MEKTLSSSSSSKKSDLTAGFRSLHPRQGTTTTPTVCLPLLFPETTTAAEEEESSEPKCFPFGGGRAIEGNGGKEKKVALKREVRLPGVLESIFSYFPNLALFCTLLHK